MTLRLKKTAKLVREIRIKLKIDLVKTKCGLLQIITMIRVAHVQKDLKLKEVSNKILNFHEIAPNFIYSQNWCVADYHNDTCHTKGFLDLKLN